MSILGEIPKSSSQRVIHAICHFILGALLGLFPTVLVVSTITFAPNANHIGIVGGILLIFCIPSGLIFMLLGLMGRGNIIAGIFKLLGRRVDPNSM